MKNLRAIATTARKPTAQNEETAKTAAAKLGIPFVARKKESMAELMKNFAADFVLIAKNDLLYLAAKDGELFFHPNMAHLRLKNIREGKGDRMAEAMKLAPGMTVLDCTMGLASDAIVANFVVGETGSVTALEINPLVAETIGFSLKHFRGDNARLTAAAKRIRVVCADYAAFLKKQADDSFDVVYFDPMFRHAFTASSAMNPLRIFADHRPLDESAVKEAMRVAKKRVVMKETSGSDEFLRLGFTPVASGGKYSKIRYGTIEL